MANAVGAALAQVAGSVDEVVVLGDRPRDQVIKDYEEKALQACVQAGADPKTVQVGINVIAILCLLKLAL